MAIDKIGSKALTDCSVVAADITPGTITGTQLAGSIANAKLANSTVTINGTSIALGASASVNNVAWQSVVVSDGSTVTTMVAGRGYFVNNTSAAGIVKLPASGTAGDTIAIKDYAGNFATNNLAIQRNGHNIQGVAGDSSIKSNRASLVLVYIDSTKGWLFTNESNVDDLENKTYTSATGGTITNSGNFRIHTFTADGNFVVASVGNSGGSGAKVSYMVIAGGGGGANTNAGGGGAGGFREGKNSPLDSYTASPLAASDSGLTVSAQTYPITVGGGGAGHGAGDCRGPGVRGSSSVFSTITSTGGGGGQGNCGPAGPTGPSFPTTAPGGSGGGGSGGPSPGTVSGAGNTPPVSPPQGNNGGTGFGNPGYSGGGGGGASAVGQNAASNDAGNGGQGVDSSINAVSTGYAGGGGGGARPGNPVGSGSKGGGTGGGDGSTAGTAGTANTGGGGGGGGFTCSGQVEAAGGNGGKGIVIIRYKYQN